MRTASLLAALSMLTVACATAPGAAPDLDLDDGMTARTIADGSDEATIVLYLAKSLDQDTLDDDVTLDSRAAANIVAYRNGADGLAGTSDDEVFDDLDELDDVSYVGNSAMDDLLDYGQNVIGLTGEDVHGVLVNSIEAEAILFVANKLSQSNLDTDVSLDSRAATNIASDRGFSGFSTLEDLDDVSYVSARAFGKLLDFAEDQGMLDDEGLVVRGGDYHATLQDAVDATSTSITIHMFAGTYAGNTEIDDTLIVRGYGKDRTLLDGEGTDRLLTITGASPCFYDMTLQNGYASYGGAATIDGGVYVVFDGVDFLDNESTAHGGAVYVGLVSSQVVIDDATMSGNVAAWFGGAAANWDALKITNSVLTDNEAQMGAAVYAYDSIEIRDTEVTYNTGDTAGRGALTLRPTDITLSNIDFFDNEPNDVVLQWGTAQDGLGDDFSATCDSTGCTQP